MEDSSWDYRRTVTSSDERRERARSADRRSRSRSRDLNVVQYGGSEVAEDPCTMWYRMNLYGEASESNPDYDSRIL
eukprot:g20267.t1